MRSTLNIGLAALLSCSAALAGPAEYAMRWSALDGGPKTADEVMKLLNLEPKKKVEVFDVRYFKVEAPADAPPKTTAILRERFEENTPEVTFKYRSEQPLPDTANWKCPLSSPKKSKFEADVSILSSGVRKVYSWSCSAVGAVAAAVPSTVKPVPIGCGARMLRRESKGVEYKVEEWRLLNGTVVLEVSWSATDNVQNQERFIEQIAALRSLIKPLDRSKTEIGTSC